MKKLVATTLALTLSGGLLAQDSTATSTTTQKSLRQRLKETSPVHVNIDNYFVAGKNKNDDIRGLDVIVDTLISYDITKQDNIRLMPEFSYSRVDSRGIGENLVSQAELELAELRYKRNILKQDAMGVNLSAEARTLLLLNDDARDNARANYHLQGRVNVSRDITDKFSLAATLRHDQLEGSRQRSTVKADSVDYFWRAYLVPSYSVTDKLSLSMKTFYNRATRTDDQKREYLYVAPTVSYAVNDILSVAAFSEMKPMKSHDNRLWASRITKSASYVVALSVSAF